MTQTQFYVIEQRKFDLALLGLPPATALMLMHALYDPKPVVFRCNVCGRSIWYQDCPTGGWWVHDIHFDSDHHDVICGGYGHDDD